MKISKEERLIIGEKAYNKVKTISELAKEYGTTYVNVFNYKKLYMKTNSIVEKEITNYDSLSNDELKKELMRKDIEIARLKKGYTVKGVGSKKEYVILKDSNTK